MRSFRWMLLLAVVALGWLGWAVLAPFGPERELFVDIPAHTGRIGTATLLQQAGAVRNRWVFLALAECRGGSLKAGEYRFDHPAAMTEVYRRLRQGDVYTLVLVIPEGFNLFDIAAAVEAAGLGNRHTFLEAASRSAGLVRVWNPQARSVEGYLFPDTYRFSRHATPAMILSTMTHRFGQVAVRLGLPAGRASRVVTLASLVEREVHMDAERAMVAGVFENRLRLGMPLQTDPTVQYASMLRGTWTGVIHQSELHSDSPYNTYAHTGLPPGPICSPGVAALRAALHPASTDALYFVANADGSTSFARDLATHQANVARYRQGITH